MLYGKVAVVTGASSGIGESLVYELARNGCNVVLSARSEEKLVEIEKDIRQKFDIKTLVVKTDVSLEEDCRNLIEKTVEYFGQIDILINNAGISMRAVFKDCQLDVIKKVMDINFWGTVYCSKYALPYLIESKGTLAGVISTAGFRGLPGRTGYSASKFAITGFLESVRTENLKTGLHVLIASPGFTQSNIRKTALNHLGQQQGETPRDEKKLMTSEEVAKKIVKAILKRKLFLITDKTGLAVRLLNPLFPAWMDKQVLKDFAKEPGSPVS